MEAEAEALPDLTPEEAGVVLKWFEGGIVYDTARPSEAITLSAFFDEYAAAMEQIPDEDVPYAVGDFHAAKIREYGMLSAGYNAVAEGDLFTAMVYTEQEEEVYAEIDRAYTNAERRCGKAWTNAWEGE